MSKQKSVDKPTSILPLFKNSVMRCRPSLRDKNLSTVKLYQAGIKEMLRTSRGAIKVVASLSIILKTGEFWSKSFRFLLYVFLLTYFVKLGYSNNLNQYLYQQSAIAQQVSSSASKETSALEAIKAGQIRQYASYTNSLKAKQENTYQKYQAKFPDSIVFISFSMPVSLIIQVLKDAKAHHMPVAIRGLIDNSFAKTTATFFDLAKKYKGIGGVQIAPQYFKTFGIKEVPAFVSIVNHNGCTENHCPNDHFFVVYGNEHIKQAFSQIDRAKRLRGL